MRIQSPDTDLAVANQQPVPEVAEAIGGKMLDMGDVAVVPVGADAIVQTTWWGPKSPDARLPAYDPQPLGYEDAVTAAAGL